MLGKELKKIFFGWWFWITNQKNDLAKDRLSVCASCSSRKWFICSECGCPLQAKARIEDESCPRSKWVDTQLRKTHYKS